MLIRRVESIVQTAEKFITDYAVFAERPADCTLSGQVIERHEHGLRRMRVKPAPPPPNPPTAEKLTSEKPSTRDDALFRVRNCPHQARKHASRNRN